MKYLFANWKMYLDVAESMILANQLASVEYDTEHVSLGVFPTALAFTEVETCFRDSAIAVGAQNVVWTPKGAYTGAVSAELYRQAGAQYALVGHSERRHVFGESDGDVKKKFDACLDAGIIPVVCVGETKEDIEQNKREYRLKKQLTILDGIDSSARCFVAYEPVWAIGTGEACDHLTAAQMHDLIRADIMNYTDASIPILYGGSVNAENVLSYAPHKGIEGFLVGTASTHLDQFEQIIRSLESE